MRYLTDGTHLFEVAAEHTVQNYGRHRGILRYAIIRDCVTEAEANVDDLHLATLAPVTPLEDAA